MIREAGFFCAGSGEGQPMLHITPEHSGKPLRIRQPMQCSGCCPASFRVDRWPQPERTAHPPIAKPEPNRHRSCNPVRWRLRAKHYVLRDKNAAGRGSRNAVLPTTMGPQRLGLQLEGGTRHRYHNTTMNGATGKPTPYQCIAGLGWRGNLTYTLRGT